MLTWGICMPESHAPTTSGAFRPCTSIVPGLKMLVRGQSIFCADQNHERTPELLESELYAKNANESSPYDLFTSTSVNLVVMKHMFEASLYDTISRDIPLHSIAVHLVLSLTLLPAQAALLLSLPFKLLPVHSQPCI